MKISVIIPAYNCEKYIAQTLDCIRTQTFPSRDLEVLVALDAPTDNTAQVVKDYASKWQDFNLRIIKLEKNSGASIARNVAIAQARGDYIHFMDADDIINTRFYESLYNAAKHTSADIALCSFIHERYSHDSVVYANQFIVSQPQDKIDITQVNLHGYSWRYLISRKFWNNLKLQFPPEMRYCEDMLIMTKMVYACNMIVTVPDAVYIYKYRMNSLLTSNDSNNELRNRCHEQAVADVAQFLQDKQLSPVKLKSDMRIGWFYLFGFIPIMNFKYSQNNHRQKYYLFGKIPVFKIRWKMS